uniref:Macaca fascicularis brain cDNA clone: QmoA-11540, similar to human neurofilament, heavy polypeptide 200kDa (NEFH), mRNA, RefSeq: NM_021076.2 n=1 Tax=Macaca fascicularis TaxID=9541 RepID=I7GP96_MACFA|nr:unnamed protein product [Macaca fascicularis]
MPCAQRRRR